MATIRLDVREISEARGLLNPRQLSQTSGVTYSVCYRMWEGSQSRIDLPVLTLLCEALDCTPNDLLVFESKKPKAKRR